MLYHNFQPAVANAALKARNTSQESCWKDLPLPLPFLLPLPLPPPSPSSLRLSGKLGKPITREHQLPVTAGDDHVRPLWVECPHHYRASCQPQSWLLTRHILHTRSGWTLWDTSWTQRVALSQHLVYKAERMGPSPLGRV